MLFLFKLLSRCYNIIIYFATYNFKMHSISYVLSKLMNERNLYICKSTIPKNLKFRTIPTSSEKDILFCICLDFVKISQIEVYSNPLAIFLVVRLQMCPQDGWLCREKIYFFNPNLSKVIYKKDIKICMCIQKNRRNKSYTVSCCFQSYVGNNQKYPYQIIMIIFY